jgi:hypothetical protein
VKKGSSKNARLDIATTADKSSPTSALSSNRRPFTGISYQNLLSNVEE